MAQSAGKGGKRRRTLRPPGLHAGLCGTAPTALVHGIFDCGIQVPMGQSLRFFEALTRKGVKSLLLCNNNGIFGEDPEVKGAVLAFICARI